MKKLLILLIGLSMLASIAFAQQTNQETELTVTAIYYSPGQNDDYANGFGAETQARFWLNPNVGLALSLGAASWQVKEHEMVASDGFVAVGASMKGNVSIIPLGGSLLFRPVDNDRIALTLEVGVRYVIVDSHVEIKLAAGNASGDFVYASDAVDIGNSFVGVIGANIEAKANKQISLLAGLGYQFDLVKGDAKWLDEDFGDNELKGFLVKAGINIKI